MRLRLRPHVPSTASADGALAEFDSTRAPLDRAVHARVRHRRNPVVTVPDAERRPPRPRPRRPLHRGARPVPSPTPLGTPISCCPPPPRSSRSTSCPPWGHLLARVERTGDRADRRERQQHRTPPTARTRDGLHRARPLHRRRPAPCSARRCPPSTSTNSVAPAGSRHALPRRRPPVRRRRLPHRRAARSSCAASSLAALGHPALPTFDAGARVRRRRPRPRRPLPVRAAHPQAAHALPELELLAPAQARPARRRPTRRDRALATRRPRRRRRSVRSCVRNDRSELELPVRISERVRSRRGRRSRGVGGSSTIPTAAPSTRSPTTRSPTGEAAWPTATPSSRSARTSS
jgi:hypothetical protein